MGNHYAWVGLWLMAAASSARSAELHFPTNEELRQIREVREVQLAPDGTRLLAVITEATAAGGRSHLWLLDRRPGGARQLTFSRSPEEKGETKAAWDPGGDAALFIADRGATGATLDRLPMAGGEAVALALARTAADKVVSAWGAPGEGVVSTVKDFAVSPEGRAIAVIAQDGDGPAKVEARTRKDDAALLDHDEQKIRLYLVSVASGAAVEVALPGDAFAVSWDRGSHRLIALAHGKSDDLGPDASAWLVNAASPGLPTPLEALPPTVHQAVFVSDVAVAFLAQCARDAPPGCMDLYAYDLTGRRVRDLTGDIKASIPDEAQLIGASAGDAIVMVLRRGTQQHAVRVHLDGAIEDLEVGQPVVQSIATNATQSGWVFRAGGASQPTTVYFAPALGAAAARVDAPAVTPAGWRSAPSRLVEWKNQGQTIQGLLYLPPQAQAGPVPLVVHVHGGPAEGFTDSYSPLVNLLLGQGWAVLQPNPRGSSGYGAAFLAANKDDLGGADFADIMAGVDAVIRQYPIDPGRTALIGYSYGGEIAAFAVGKTRRFRAIVSGAPVIDQMSEYGTEDSSWYDRWYFGKPHERFEAAWRQSPVAYAANAKTPILILQGDKDESDPMGQSLELYRALRQAGDAVSLVIYPRELHDDLHRNFYGEVSPEPWHGVDLRRRMIQFIAQAFADPATSMSGERSAPRPARASTDPSLKPLSR
jgi:dipeptidyl aminopeptidase/acylaminoacyl peptidase